MSNTDKKILILDDEPDLLELCADALEMEGYQVFPFSTGPDAIEFLKSSTVDLIVSDALMPDMNGMEFFERVREIADTAIPFILSTGQIDLDGELFKSVGVVKVLVKPFDISDLVDEAKRLIK